MQEQQFADAGFVRVCSLEELPPGRARVETIGTYEVGVFNVEGDIYAIDDVCPHVDGPLHSGPVDTVARTVTCPLHAWEFHLADGTSCMGRRSVASFAVEVRDGSIYVWSQPRQ